MLEMQVEKGSTGAKRSSWAKVHYRDLALSICESNKDMSVEELAELFLDALQKHPEYMNSIALYVMANTRASLQPRTGAKGFAQHEAKMIEKIAAKTLVRLMELTMPSGRTLGESTGSECSKAGGWLAKVGKAVGPTGIVGEKLTEEQLRKMLPK